MQPLIKKDEPKGTLPCPGSPIGKAERLPTAPAALVVAGCRDLKVEGGPFDAKKVVHQGIAAEEKHVLKKSDNGLRVSAMHRPTHHGPDNAIGVHIPSDAL